MRFFDGIFGDHEFGPLLSGGLLKEGVIKKRETVDLLQPILDEQKALRKNMLQAFINVSEQPAANDNGKPTNSSLKSEASEME